MFGVGIMQLLTLAAAVHSAPIQANMLSPTDMLIVGIVAIMLFGNRLPEVARSLGRSMSEFKKGMHDLESEVKTSFHSATSSRPSYPEAVRSPARVDESISQEPMAASPGERMQSTTASPVTVSDAQVS
jgi:TatA/E family protein of Tat protein translocase